MTGACPACGSARTRPAFTVNEHRFARCRSCESLYLPESPSQEQTRDLYAGERYFVKSEHEPAGGSELLGYTTDYLADRDHIEQKFSEVLEHIELHLPERGRLLDVGCGPGFLLSSAHGRGWQARGVELNEWAARFAHDELGLDVHVGALEGAGLGDGELDAVTMMDLIEHVAEPGAMVAEAARVLRPGGVLALLTPDAGSPVSRLLGRRWPEAQRAPEHVVLLSVRGMAALLDRHGFDALGWHSVGKTSTVRTLVSDVSPVAPAVAERVLPALGGALAERTFEFDPRTKFVFYAKRRRGSGGRVGRSPLVPRYPKRVPGRSSNEAILDDLRLLGGADRLCAWMYEQFARFVGGTVVEVGAGIGTFTGRLLDGGAERLLAIEPDPGCASVLEARFVSDPRVVCARDFLPEAPSLASQAGEVDLVVCQNVLEHIEDHVAAVVSMAGALRPGGRLVLLVPAHPRLYGSLDLAYGHWRRYTPAMVRELMDNAQLETEDVHHFNALGIPGWWAKGRGNSTQIGPAALRVYETLVAGWRHVEARARPPAGLTLVGIGRKSS